MKDALNTWCAGCSAGCAAVLLVLSVGCRSGNATGLCTGDSCSDSTGTEGEDCLAELGCGNLEASGTGVAVGGGAGTTGKGGASGELALLQATERASSGTGNDFWEAMSVAPDGRFAYMAGDAGIELHALDECGLLGPVGKVFAAPAPESSSWNGYDRIDVAPMGSLALAVGYDDGDQARYLDAFGVDSTSGAVEFLGRKTLPKEWLPVDAQWATQKNRYILTGHSIDFEGGAEVSVIPEVRILDVAAGAEPIAEVDHFGLSYCNESHIEGQPDSCAWTSSVGASHDGAAVWLPLNEALVVYAQGGGGEYSPIEAKAVPFGIDPEPPEGTVLIDADGALGVACADEVHLAPSNSLVYMASSGSCPGEKATSVASGLKLAVLEWDGSSTVTHRQVLDMSLVACSGEPGADCSVGATSHRTMAIDSERGVVFVVLGRRHQLVRIPLDPTSGEFLPEKADAVTLPAPGFASGCWLEDRTAFAPATGRLYVLRTIGCPNPGDRRDLVFVF